MGLQVSIYRSTYDSELNAFHGKHRLTVTNIEGPFEPSDDAPAAELATNPFGDPIVVPADRGAVRGMAGGTFAYSSDSRFSLATHMYGAVPIHDRFES